MKLGSRSACFCGSWERYNAGSTLCKEHYHARYLGDKRNQQRQALRHRAIAKLGGACVACGNTDERVLQFDHIVPCAGHRGDHKQLMRDVAYGITDNIRLLCANCHAIRTWHDG
jgi:5-methylcytosine-specific restriction endonuclease McrA